MRVLALGGAGAVCKEATRDLAQFSEFDEIVVADYNVKAAQELVDSIGDRRLKAIFLDANDEKSLHELFPQFDVVMNGLPFKYDYVVNKVCVEEGVNGLDLSSDDPQFQLHQQALEKEMIFIPGVGATPGTTNAMVAWGASHLDEVERVQIYFAAFRSFAPAPGLLTTTLWEFDPEEPARGEVYYEDGAMRPAPPFSGEKIVRFHDLIGEQPVYFVPHDEAQTIPHSYPKIKHASVRGCFPPKVMATGRVFKEMGLLSHEPSDLLGGRSPFEVSRDLLWASPETRKNDNWAYGLVVEVEGLEKGRKVRYTYRNSHPPQEEWGGSSAYFKNVGIPLSIGAQLIAEGAVEARGVVPPEIALPFERFIAELKRRGIVITEVREEL